MSSTLARIIRVCGFAVLEQSVSHCDQYNLTGRYLVTKLWIPASVEVVGNLSFAGLSSCDVGCVEE